MQNKIEIHVRFLGSCCDRPCHLLCMDCGRTLKPWAGKAIEHSELNMLQLWVLGKYAESSEDNGGLTRDISEGKTVPGLFVCYFQLRNCGYGQLG